MATILVLLKSPKLNIRIADVGVADELGKSAHRRRTCKRLMGSMANEADVVELAPNSLHKLANHTSISVGCNLGSIEDSDFIATPEKAPSFDLDQNDLSVPSGLLPRIRVSAGRNEPTDVPMLPGAPALSSREETPARKIADEQKVIVRTVSYPSNTIGPPRDSDLDTQHVR